MFNHHYDQLEAKRSSAESKISAEKSAREAAEGLHTQLVDEKVNLDDEDEDDDEDGDDGYDDDEDEDDDEAAEELHTQLVDEKVNPIFSSGLQLRGYIMMTMTITIIQI